MYKENKSLKDLLYKRLEIFDMTRNELRAYGEQVKTFKNPNGYDLATTDRELRHLTQEGLIRPIKRRGFNVSYTKAV